MTAHQWARLPFARPRRPGQRTADQADQACGRVLAGEEFTVPKGAEIRQASAPRAGLIVGLPPTGRLLREAGQCFADRGEAGAAVVTTANREHGDGGRPAGTDRLPLGIDGVQDKVAAQPVPAVLESFE
jgi:hypothetical protein